MGRNTIHIGCFINSFIGYIFLHYKKVFSVRPSVTDCAISLITYYCLSHLSRWMHPSSNQNASTSKKSFVFSGIYERLGQWECAYGETDKSIKCQTYIRKHLPQSRSRHAVGSMVEVFNIHSLPERVGSGREPIDSGGLASTVVYSPPEYLTYCCGQ